MTRGPAPGRFSRAARGALLALSLLGAAGCRQMIGIDDAELEPPTASDPIHEGGAAAGGAAADGAAADVTAADREPSLGLGGAAPER